MATSFRTNFYGANMPPTLPLSEARACARDARVCDVKSLEVSELERRENSEPVSGLIPDLYMRCQ